MQNPRIKYPALLIKYESLSVKRGGDDASVREYNKPKLQAAKSNVVFEL